MSVTSTILLVLGVLLLLSAGIVTLLKGKWGSLAVGLLISLVWIVAALRLARPRSWWARRFYNHAKREKTLARAANPRYRALVIAALLLALALFPALFALFDAYRIPGAAMETTLRCARPEIGCSEDASDRVLALRYVPGRGPQRGDITVFRTPTTPNNICPSPGSLYVQRLIGLPGDRIEIRDQLYLNDQPLNEPYLNDATPGERFSLVIVPEDEYFLLGDNRFQSCDSREFGTVPRNALLSRIVTIYWPLNRLSLP